MSAVPIINKRLDTGMIVDSREIRLKNLQFLLEKEELELGHGYKKAFAEKIDTKPAYLSQMLNPNHPTGIGSALARRIEKALALPRGWMDSLHENKKEECTQEEIEFKALESAIFAVNEYCDTHSIKAPPEKRARVTAALYKLIVKNQHEPDDTLINALLEIL